MASTMATRPRENTRLVDIEGRVRETCGAMPPWRFPGCKYAIGESIVVIKRNVIVTLHFGRTEMGEVRQMEVIYHTTRDFDKIGGAKPHFSS